MTASEVVPNAFCPSSSDYFAGVSSDVLRQEAAGHLAR